MAGVSTRQTGRTCTLLGFARGESALVQPIGVDEHRPHLNPASAADDNGCHQAQRVAELIVEPGLQVDANRPAMGLVVVMMDAPIGWTRLLDALCATRGDRPAEMLMANGSAGVREMMGTRTQIISLASGADGLGHFYGVNLGRACQSVTVSS